MSGVGKIFFVAGNKYFIAFLVFAVIMLFVDHNNLFEQMARRQELKELEAKKKYYGEEIEKSKKQLSDLSNDPSAIEKYAREKFYMKRDNEDIFLVENATDTLKK